MDTNKQIEYYPGQIFEGEYPEEAAEFCNNSGKYFIEEIEPLDDGTRRFEIKEIPAPDIEEVRDQKYAENDSKANEARESKLLQKMLIIDGKPVIGMFRSNKQTQLDLQTAINLLGRGTVAVYPWIDEDGELIGFTHVGQPALVLETIMEWVGRVYELWAEYNSQILQAETLADLYNIKIIYNLKGEDEDAEADDEGINLETE